MKHAPVYLCRTCVLPWALGPLCLLSAVLACGSSEGAFINGVETFDGTILDTTTWEPCTISDHPGTINQNDALLLTTRADYTTRSLTIGVGDKVAVDVVVGSAPGVGLYLTTNSEGDTARTFLDSGFLFIEYRPSQFHMGFGSSGSSSSDSLASLSPGDESRTLRMELERLGPTSYYGAVYDGPSVLGSRAISLKYSGRWSNGPPDPLFVSLVTAPDLPPPHQGPARYHNVTLTPCAWQGEIDQCYAPATSTTRMPVTATTRVAQVFTVERSGILTHVDLQLDRNWTMPDEGLMVDIRPVVGGMPVADDAAALAAGLIAPDRIVRSPLGDFSGIDLSGGIPVKAGDVLAVVARTDASGSSPFAWARGDSVYAGGDGFCAGRSGSFWPTGYDYAFQIYVAEIPEPSSLMLALAAALGRAAWACRRRKSTAVDAT